MVQTIKGRLALVVAFLSVTLAAIGTMGLVGMQHADANNLDLYRNRLPSVVAIGDAATYVGRERLAFDRAALSAGSPAVEEIIQHGAMMRRKSDDAWRAFMSLPKPPDEARQAAAFGRQRLAVKALLDRGYRDVRANDRDGMLVVATRMLAAYGELERQGDALRQRQIDDSQAAYDEGRADFRRFRLIDTSAVCPRWSTRVRRCTLAEKPRRRSTSTIGSRQPAMSASRAAGFGRKAAPGTRP